MKKNVTFIFSLGLLLLAFTPFSIAGVYTDTIQFDPDQGIFWNYPWQQCVSDLPAGEQVDSVQVQLRAKVFSSGFYPPALLISDTNVFYASDPDYRIGYLALRTSFYNNNYTLTPTQIEWLANDGCAFFEVLSNGGTYYLDTCLLTVVTSIPPCQGDLFIDKVVDEQDLQLFADYFGRDDCIGDCLGDFGDDGDVDGTDLFAFTLEYGRDNCP